MSYIKNNFLLETGTAEKLYNVYAKDAPIYPNVRYSKTNLSGIFTKSG